MTDVKIHGWVQINNDFEQMLICAERYAIGRQSYLPPDTIAYIRFLIPQLSSNTLYIIATDIAEEFRRYARIDKEMPYGKEWAELSKIVIVEYNKKKAVQDAT